MRDNEKKTVARARSLRRRLTKAEVILWRALRRGQLDGHHFRRQVPVGPYIADFACVKRKLIVEVDGATHAEDHELAHDARRSAFLKAQGWALCRVNNLEVYENLSGVLEGISIELRHARFG
jgi:very-short-patch-repair endonuclease